MSYHKSRPEDTKNPNVPRGTAMIGGRVVLPHGENDSVRSPQDEAEKVREFHEARKVAKETGKREFDPKTGDPKVDATIFKPDPVGDANGSPVLSDEAKKHAEEEKKKIAEAEAKAKADKAKAEAEAKAKAEAAKKVEVK